MFAFLKKLTSHKKKELLYTTFNQEGIYIRLEENGQNSDTLDLYKNLFIELSYDGLGRLRNDNTIILNHKTIYELLNDERASMLMLPDLFSGELEVKHRGFLDNDAIFEYTFLKNGETIFGSEVIGSILKISSDEYYILPEPMQKSIQLIAIANETKEALHRYEAIEYMQKHESDGIIYKGLKENDIVRFVDKVGIDIIEKEDGSLDIYPLIPGLDTEFVVKNTATIINHNNTSLLLTKTTEDKILRYVLDEKKLSGAKKIVSTKTIPKEQADNFKTNPEAFLGEIEKGEIDLSMYRLNRITGLRTEAYIGFFGSTKLETPMSQVLNPGEEVEVINKHTIEEIIDSLNDEEKLQLQQDIAQAKKEGFEEISIKESESLPIELVEDILKKEKPENILEKSQILNKPEFLGINPNDENSIGETSNETICEIKITARKRVQDWQNLLYNPKPHQVAALNWMKELYSKGYKGGLLADDMGLGKTFQVVSFINYLYNVKPKPLDHKNHRILIVAPSILLTAWKNEIENSVIDKTAFRIKILQGKNNALVKLREAFKEGKEKAQYLANNDIDVIDLLRYNIIITTYETLSTYQLAFAHKELFNFEVCVFDEAQKIKNPNSRVTQAAKGISANIPFTMIVTGTPIENELRDLWSLFDAFVPDFIGTWREFRETYVKPLNNNNNIGIIEKKLREKIGDYMLRRLKKDHLEGLPEKRIELLYINMNEEEINIHNSIIGSNLHPMEKLQKLRLLSLHPSLIEMDKILDIDILGNITKPDNFFKPTKMKALLELLNKIKEKEEKVLIFVIRHSMQTLLKTALEKYYGLEIDIINGKNNKQDIANRKLEKFENKPGFNILILSPLAAGVGLTITAANNVIHLERHWNPAKEDQASDRVYRIGQEKDVSIYHFIHKANNIKTFDEGLNELIQNKKSLSDGTLIPTPAISDKDIVETFFNKIKETEKWELLSPQEFEIEVMRLFEKAGYRCNLTQKYPTEAGADIIGVKNEKKIVIQCKHTRKRIKQSKTALYQLISEAKKAYPDAIYIAVTNYYFNNNARKLAKENNIKLIELEELNKLQKNPLLLEKI